MFEQLTRYTIGFAAVFVIALGGACAAEQAKKEYAPKAPQLQAPLFRYVHCATSGGDSPCALDPAMQRLNVDPLLDRPDFTPAR